tara:strand:- start:80 stop:271 length:192 start_codon:yes stop_codon:yes gene_type:complete
MDSLKKIEQLKRNINEIKDYLEDFVDLKQAKQNKITKLENEIYELKKKISEELDALESIINQK